MSIPAITGATLLEPLREIAPFPGLMVRLGAFVVDLVVLFMIGLACEHTARATLLQFNPALPWLGYLIIFAYLWLANGPLGRGRTLGKALFSLQVVGRDGRPLSWGAALRRALIQQISLWMWMIPEGYAVGLPGHVVLGPLVLAQKVGWSITIVLMMAIAMHPFKRGWHDLWAGSYVTRDPTPPSFQQALATPPDVVIQRRIALNFKLTFMFWCVATALLLLTSRGNWGEDARQVSAASGVEKAAPIPPFRITRLVWPRPEQQVAFDMALRNDRVRETLTSDKTATTDTLATLFRNLGAVDGATILLEAELPCGAITDEMIQDPAFHESVKSLITLLGLSAVQMHQNEPNVYNDSRRVAILLVEPFQFMLYNKTMARARIMGPSDPTTGTLRFEMVQMDPGTGGLIPLGSNDSATTATQTHGASTPTPAR